MKAEPAECAKCGYLMVGLPTTICPECGHCSYTGVREGVFLRRLGHVVLATSPTMVMAAIPATVVEWPQLTPNGVGPYVAWYLLALWVALLAWPVALVAIRTPRTAKGAIKVIGIDVALNLVVVIVGAVVFIWRALQADV